jgi:hypothetical protein
LVWHFECSIRNDMLAHAYQSIKRQPEFNQEK